MKDERSKTARGDFWHRLRATVFLLPALFAPHARLRVIFHRLRGVDIGRHVEIGYGCYVGGVYPFNVHIEDNVTVAGPSAILDHDNAHHYTFGGDVVCGEVRIREGSFIGIGSVVYPGVTIGPRAIVGALSFVKSDVPPECIVAGQPATVRRFVNLPSSSQGKPKTWRGSVCPARQRNGNPPG